MRIRRRRGWSLGYYVGAIIFGFASATYIVKPVRDELEKRRREKEQQEAIYAIEEAAKLDEQPLK